MGPGPKLLYHLQGMCNRLDAGGGLGYGGGGGGGVLELGFGGGGAGREEGEGRRRMEEERESILDCYSYMAPCIYSPGGLGP